MSLTEETITSYEDYKARVEALEKANLKNRVVFCFEEAEGNALLQKTLASVKKAGLPTATLIHVKITKAEFSSPGCKYRTDAKFKAEPICSNCGDKISDRFLLQVNGLQYHTDCLSCCICSTNLQSDSSCFFREGQVYCKNDYYRTFGTKCAKCTRWISSSDWVRRARDSHSLCEQVYHLACFACDACKRQLSTGEEFALFDQRVLCKTHYQELVEGPSDESDDSVNDGDPNHISSKSKTKRVRTTFTDEQLQVLQANFIQDSNPDGQDLERIAQITGLSKRVTQVWFQNSRARQKKNSSSKKSSSQVFRRQINLRLTPNFSSESMCMDTSPSTFSHSALCISES